MRLGILSTSWPSSGRPWAGHFVRDQAVAFQRMGWQVEAIVPHWEVHGAVDIPAGMGVRVAHVPGEPGPLKTSWPLGAQTLGSLRRQTRHAEVDMWLCHWWPTSLALPSGVPCGLVLLGPAVDLLESLPASVAHWLAERGQVVAVAPGLAHRFAERAGLSKIPPVIGMGARPSSGALGRWAPDWWLGSRHPRLLSVGRDVPGKGWSTVKSAAAMLPEVAWLRVTPEMGLGPREIRALMVVADLLVIPSQSDPGTPGEGRPHVIAQATVAGLPMVGGPNRAVSDAMRALGQQPVVQGGARALAGAIREALPQRDALKRRLEVHSHRWSWKSVTGTWMELIRHHRGA